MTITIRNDKDRASRGDGLHLVDSQKTERVQAQDPPQVWPPVSVIDRLDAWWNRVSVDPWFWKTLGWLGLIAVVIAALVVTL